MSWLRSVAADLAAGSCRSIGARAGGWLVRSSRSAGCTRTRPPIAIGWACPLFELGTRVLDTIDVRDEARRVMTELVASTGESVDLAVRDGDSVVFIDKIDGTGEVRAFTRSGQRARLHATAAGKVFLAAMPAEELATYLARPLPAATPATISSPEELAAVVEATRRQGYATNRGELFAEAGALAVPVLDPRGTCVAALGLNIPLSRLTDDRIADAGRRAPGGDRAHLAGDPGSSRLGPTRTASRLMRGGRRRRIAAHGPRRR